MVITIKRKGHAEPFDERKVYASIYSAAMSSHLSEEESERLAEETCMQLSRWIHSCDKVTSHKIKEEVYQLLCENGHKDIATMYKHTLDIC